ncbi:MAG: tRNA-dihydrouridine synthase, partial [Gammaproteobacteria bacterium]|nr:tRNA-dihydrouridine synthase [Gammaproteobacteria bacterium]
GQALALLRRTGADAVMIGRAAQGRPWIFRDIASRLRGGGPLPEPSVAEVADILLGHLQALYGFYGEHMGLRIARKHLAWYSQPYPGAAEFRARINHATGTAEQLRLVRGHFDQLAVEQRAA